MLKENHPEDEAMTTESEASSSENPPRKRTPATTSPASPGGKKQTISPAERWLLVRENAYLRIQKRGFVGGNPLEDWLKAEEEIDANYATDFRGVFTLTDPAAITEQLRSVFAVYGLSQLSVESLLDAHRDSMEKLAAFNRRLLDSTSELADQQTALVETAVREGMKTLQYVGQGRVSTDWVARNAALSMKTIENALSQVKALTDSESETPPKAARARQGDSESKSDGDT
jgi:hypothetical protein